MVVGTAVWRQLGIAVARMGWHGVALSGICGTATIGTIPEPCPAGGNVRVGDREKAMLKTTDGMLDLLTTLFTFGYLGYWSLAGFGDVISSLSDRFAFFRQVIAIAGIRVRYFITRSAISISIGALSRGVAWNKQGSH